MVVTVPFEQSYAVLPLHVMPGGEHPPSLPVPLDDPLLLPSGPENTSGKLMSSEASITPELEPELDPVASPPLPSSPDDAPPLLPPLLDPPSPVNPVSGPVPPQPAATLQAHAKRKAHEKDVRTAGSDHAEGPDARSPAVRAAGRYRLRFSPPGYM